MAGTFRSRQIVVVIAVAAMSGCGPGPAASKAPKSPAADKQTAGDTSLATPQKLEAEHLPNAFRIHAKVISGGQPEGDAAFAELKGLGVKTIISVDGAKPDVAAAKKFGLRYVHLPHGYDGIPEARAKELAKAVRELEGPIYIHCHHGKHRSPAAAAVACVTAGLIDPSAAVGVLKAAGTSENYRGLYQSAESARKLDEALLTALDADFPETAKIPPLAEGMVAVEHTHDHLKAIAAEGWKTPAKMADLVPAHEALLLKEHFTELLRTEAVKAEPEGFQNLLKESQRDSEELERELEQWSRGGGQAPVPSKITGAFERVTKNCTACHRTYRDVPLAEKR